ncbi:MAG: ABC-2 transporter permease [Anaerolineae bacterium]|nr:ABC-2 transporter permease [Anaerolineae bacterium]
MHHKIIAIAWKDITTTFKDRDAVAYLVALPIVLSAIVGLAFGTGGDVSIDPVPVAVVNQDQGVTLPGGETLSLGETLERAFVPSGDPAQDEPFAAIHDLTDGTAYADADRAREEIADGDLAALITIGGADFTANALSGDAPGTVDILYDSGRSIGPSVVRSIVSAITNGMNSVILAQRLGPAALAEIGATVGADEAAIASAAAELGAAATSIAAAAPIRLEQVDLQGKTRSFDALQYFAPSMAILFMTFAMGASATAIRLERERWTLQRILTTPTPRWAFMGGKLLGMYGTGLAQMILLIVATTLVARLMGRQNSLWGTDGLAIALLVLAVVFAATSLGLLIAALSRTAEQANTYSSIAALVLGMLGGSFVPIENLPGVLSWLPKLTLNYWGIRGFYDVATGEAALAGVSTHLLALAVIGVVLFVASLWRFSRRQEL